MRKYFLAVPDTPTKNSITRIITENDPDAKIIVPAENSEIGKDILNEKPEFVVFAGDPVTPDSDFISFCKKVKTKDLLRGHLVLVTSPEQQQIFRQEIIDSGINAVFSLPLDELSFLIHHKNWLAALNKIQATQSAREGAPAGSIRNKKLALAKEDRYSAVFEKSTDGIFIIDNQGCIVEANDSIGAITGIDAEECIGMKFWNFLYQLTPVQDQTERDYELLQGYLKQILTKREKKSSGKLTVRQINRPDEQVRFIEIVFYPIHSDQKFFTACMIRDITERKLFEEAIKNSESKYHGIFDDNKDGISIFFLNPDNTVSNFIEANKAAYELIGFTKEEFLSMNIFDIKHHEKPEFFVNAFSKLKRKGFFNTETKIRRKDGQPVDVDLNIQTIKYNNQVAIMIIIRDITSRKMVEFALKESETRFKMLFEKAPIGYQSLDEQGNLVDVNETWLQMMGYQKEEVIGRWFGNFVTPDFIETYVRQCNQVRQQQQVHAELELYKKNGKIIRIQIRGFVGHFPNEKTAHLHCVLSDITELHNASKAIADEQILLRTLIDAIPDMIFVKDILGRKLISNKADLALLGLTDEKEVIGKTDLELFENDMAWQFYHEDLTVISTAKPIINKLHTYVKPDGSRRIISSTKIPLTSESGAIIGLIGVSRDITREKLSEQKITQLSKGIEQSPSSIIITDITGNIEYANPKVEEKTGYKSEEILGKNPRIFQSGYTSIEEYKKLWKTIKSGQEYHGEIQNRKKNGEIYWESVLISPLRNDEGRIVNYIAIKEDITSRKKYELELSKLNIAIEQSPASVIITDTEGVIEYVNKKFVLTTGYKADELIGKMVRILKPGHLDDALYVELWNCLYSGKEWRGEHLNRTKNNINYWESVLISPAKNQEGKITNYIILSEDISDRKKMEHDLIQAKEKAEESDRLKSAFLANMSHEIRTPLNSILGFSDLLADQNLDTRTRLEYAGLINTSGTNLLAIINDVLDISKIEAGQITLTESLFSASELVTEIKKEYSYKARTKGIELKVSLPENSGAITIKSDEVRVKLVLINFVGNALKFTDSGYIEIGITQNGDEIRFYVKDTGIGIAKEYHEKIFERFRQVEGAQTRRYSGNGLGLAITKNLAELLGGRIWVDSEPGKGSTFYFAVSANV